MLNIILMNFDFPTDEKEIAVALSGGGDSMALAHMIVLWGQKNKCSIHLLTVNHNLRPEAKDEAIMISQWVKNFPNSTHHILTWNHNQNPTSAIMEAARTVRYSLMYDFCTMHGIKTLCVAHHGDDQLETFLFRLAKGSGLDGLKSMSVWSDYQDIKLYRPLLGFTHQELINYCQDNQLKWIEDPSNQNEKYARPRIRKALQAEGFDTKRFTKTLQRLSRGYDALVWLTQQAYDKSFLNNQTYDWQVIQSYPLDIQIRVLQKIISETGESESNHPPKLERIEEIIDTLMPQKSATLYGCIITLGKDAKTLEIKRSSP